MDWQTGDVNATYGKHTIQADGQAITVNGTRLPLDGIERLATSFSRSRAQGSWGKLSAGARMQAGEQLADITLNGGQTSDDYCEWFPFWDQLNGYLDAEVKPRIRSRILTTLAQGGSADVGGLTKGSKGRYRLTAQGIQPKRLFGKSVPWSEFVDTSVELVNYRFNVDKGAGKVGKNSWYLGVGEWNAWLVPELIAHFNGR